MEAQASSSPSFLILFLFLCWFMFELFDLLNKSTKQMETLDPASLSVVWLNYSYFANISNCCGCEGKGYTWHTCHFTCQVRASACFQLEHKQLQRQLRKNLGGKDEKNREKIRTQVSQRVTYTTLKCVCVTWTLLQWIADGDEDGAGEMKMWRG